MWTLFLSVIVDRLIFFCRVMYGDDGDDMGLTDQSTPTYCGAGTWNVRNSTIAIMEMSRTETERTELNRTESE